MQNCIKGSRTVFLPALISLFILFTKCASNPKVMEDKTLTQLTLQTKGDWNWTLSNDILTVESTEVMWIAFQNVAGLNVADTSHKKYTPVFLQKNGTKANARWKFKVEPKWSDSKIKTAGNENSKIKLQIKDLRKKHTIDHLKISYRWNEEVFWGATEEEYKRVGAYKKEKESLQNSMVKIPYLYSDLYSLYSLGYNWSAGNDASHMKPYIYPEAENEKITELTRLIDQNLRKTN